MKKYVPGMLLTALMVVCGGWQAGEVQAQVWGHSPPTGYEGGNYNRPDLYRQYYSHPGSNASYEAQMYPSPIPVPAHVGHTYYTYPPFSPHLMMRRHMSWQPGRRTFAWYH